MSTLKLTSQFKKDLKRYKHNHETIGKLEEILRLLANGLPIPEINRSHLLTGNYNGYMECHVDKSLGLLRDFLIKENFY